MKIERMHPGHPRVGQEHPRHITSDHALDPRPASGNRPRGRAVGPIAVSRPSAVTNSSLHGGRSGRGPSRCGPVPWRPTASTARAAPRRQRWTLATPTIMSANSRGRASFTGLARQSRSAVASRSLMRSSFSRLSHKLDSAAAYAGVRMAVLRFGVLGPLSVDQGPVPEAKNRVLLATLLCCGRAASSRSTSSPSGCGTAEPPGNPRRVVQTHVVRLRRWLGDGAEIHTRGGGYLMEARRRAARPAGVPAAARRGRLGPRPRTRTGPAAGRPGALAGAGLRRRGLRRAARARRAGPRRAAATGAGAPRRPRPATRPRPRADPRTARADSSEFPLRERYWAQLMGRRCTAAGGGPRRSTPTGPRSGACATNSASSPAPSCANSTRRSSRANRPGRPRRSPSRGTAAGRARLPGAARPTSPPSPDRRSRPSWARPGSARARWRCAGPPRSPATSPTGSST